MGSDNFAYPNLPYFEDVPQNHPYYCADADMRRLQMAIFLIRGKFGNTLNRYFTDAAAGSVEFLARLFLTPYAVY